jgi:chromosome segregation ATPase
MASCKSYQNRKKEIENLNHLVQRYEVYLKNKDMRISQLERQLNQYANTLTDYLSVMSAPPVILTTNKEEIERLQTIIHRLENITVMQGKEIDQLKMTIRLYREYVLKAYDPDATDIIEIPNCLKPLDSIKYVGEKSGFNHQS